MWKLGILVIIFFLNGCIKPIPEKELVEKPTPRFKILNKVEFYEIEDYRKFNDTYWLINIEEFDIASDRIKKKDYKIRYYEKWGIMYNQKFVDKQKEFK